MILILAFDISSVSTGWSVVCDGRFVSDAYGLILPNKKETVGTQLSYFRSELIRLINLYSPQHIICEDIFRGPNTKTFKTLAQFRGVAIQTIYETTKKDPYSLLAVEARRILGLGIKKEEAFAGIIKLCKLKHFTFEKHNDVADSIALGLALNELLKEDKNERLISSAGRGKKRRPKPNQKSIPQVSSSVSSRQKPRKQRSRRKV